MTIGDVHVNGAARPWHTPSLRSMNPRQDTAKLASEYALTEARATTTTARV